jgi:LuxR family maltose regulon positive regulatory protein
VVLVVAPAGFGKTVALADFARTSGFPVAWLSMSPADADVVTFLDALVQALRRIVPDFGRRAVQIVRRSGARAYEALAAELADELATHAGPLGLVLDDFHVLDPSAGQPSESVGLIDALIERAPSNLILAIGSRTLPALRHASLAAAGRLHGVAADQLRFSREEVASFLGLAADDQQAGQAYDRTGGWAAALTLGGGFMPGEALAAYVRREIWEGLQPEVRRFLARASVPPTLSADLCRDVLDEPDGPIHLEDARRRGLFVAALPGHRWRLHDLFRDFLREQLRTTEPQVWAELHRRVANDMLADGDPAGAITLLIDAGLDHDAAEAMDDHASRIAAEGRWVAVRRWIEALPARIVRARHRLTVLEARAHVHSGDATTALGLLDRAVGASLEAGDLATAAEALAARAARLNVSGRLDEALADCVRARELLDGREHGALATIGRVEGLVAAQRGDAERALGALAVALGVAQRCRDRAESAMCERSIGWVYSLNGHPGAAAAYYARAARIWDELEDLDAAAEIRVSLGHVYAEQGADDLARRTFEEARGVAERVRHRRVLSYALSNLGAVERDAGDLAVAEQNFNLALDLARQGDDYQLIVLCLDHLAQCQIQRSDVLAAEALARQAVAEADRLASPQFRARAAITLAWAQMLRGEPAAAERTAGQALDVLGQSGPLRDRARLYLARAICRHERRDRAWQEDVREAAIALAATPARGFLRGLWPLVEPYLSMMRGDAATRGALDTLSRAGQVAARSAAPPAALAVAVHAGPRIEARLLGRPSITLDGAPPRDPDGNWKRQAVRELFYLLEAHRAGLSPDALIERLWPDAPPGRGQALLWNHVTRLRALLGATNRREGRSIVRQENGVYQLYPDLPLTTDAAAFEDAVARADAAAAGTVEEGEALAAADGLYAGPYLAGVDAVWAVSRRASLARAHARVLHRLAERALAADPRGAVGHAERLLRTDPMSERACELLIRCHRAAGEPDRARQAYRSFARRLKKELGVSPAPRLSALVDLPPVPSAAP